jgi:hypothetical protein
MTLRGPVVDHDSPDVPCVELRWLLRAVSIVHHWEYCCLRRILATAEAGSLVQGVALELQAEFDGPPAALADTDYLLQSYRVVDAWDRSATLRRINAAEAAALAESIARALAGGRQPWVPLQSEANS